MARLVREVAGANPRTVLVVMSSYPYLMPDEAPAVVWTSHAGQETGRAIASLLAGEHEFEGRLPQAWPACDADLPDALDYDIIKAGWTYQYATAPARFPFGHGLTYTTFGYGELTVALAGGAVTATLDITNAGDRAGSEVVQLYASYPGADQPRRRLIGFTRVALEPGETGTATIGVPVSRLELWDVAAGRMALPAGPLEILAGASSDDIRQTAALLLPLTARCRRDAEARPGRRRRLRRSSEHHAHRHHPFLRTFDHRRGPVTCRLGALRPASTRRGSRSLPSWSPARRRAAGGSRCGWRNLPPSGSPVSQRRGAVHRRTLLVAPWSPRRFPFPSRPRRCTWPCTARCGWTGSSL